MSLAVPSVPASLPDYRNAPPTPFSDLLDLSDNPDTPGTTYSFQGPRQNQNMQGEQHYLAEPILDRPSRLNTDDEMFDSDMDRKDDDLDLLDVSSNVGVDLEDGSIIMEEDFLDTAPQTYDNDDLMIDEVEVDEEDMLFQQQREPSLVPPVSSSASLENSDGPNQSQDTLRPNSAQATVGDTPLFSFNQPNDPTNAHNISFAVPEKPSVPDHSLYEDVPAEVAEVVEETASVEIQTLKPKVEENTAKPNTDVESLHSHSPAEVAEETNAVPDELPEGAPATDSAELDNDFHHNGSWSENTSTTLAHEPTLLEDQQIFAEEDEEDGDNHIGDAEAGTEGHSPAEFAIEEFSTYNLHPIVVEWEKNRLSLFPTHPDSNLEFLIQDPQVCEKGINELFQEFRKVLDESISQDVELFIEFEGLGLTLGEDNVSCSSISLQYILNLHVQLHKQDGIEMPEPLRINLNTRPSFSKQITSLVAAASQGMGFSEAIGLENIQEDHTESGIVTQNIRLQQNDQQEEHNNSEDQNLPEEKQSDEMEDTLQADSGLTTPRAVEGHRETLVEAESKKYEAPVEAKIEEEDDDDDFDLEYGTEENKEVVKDQSEADDAELKTDDTKSTPGSSSASETPKPTTEQTNKDTEVTTASAEIGTPEVLFEEISDEVSPHNLQQPEEIEDSDSSAEADHTPSIFEDEELIEYEEEEEEEDEVIHEPASADIPTEDADEHQSVESDESSHHSPIEEGHPQKADSPHVHGTQGLESPGRQSSHESIHAEEDIEKVNRAGSVPGANGDNTNEDEDVSTNPKAASSIPVFHGDDGPEGEYQYDEEQQEQKYEGHQYDDQAQQFQTEVQELDEESAGYENSNHNDKLQDAEYFEGDFEYNAEYASDEQNGYLDGAGNELQGDADGYDYADDDGAYNEFGGEQEYPAEDEDGYPIDYPHEGYEGDTAAYYRDEGFGVDNVETVGDEYAVPTKGDNGHVLLPSDAVDILKKPSVIVSQVEEEQLIDYEDDEEELVKEPAHNPPQLLKSPSEQKRMREVEPEESGYDSTSENQAAKRVRSE